MTKKMRELQNKILGKVEASKAFMEDGRTEEAENALNEADSLQKELDLLARIEEKEMEKVQEKIPEQKSKVSGFGIMKKLLSHQQLSDTEKGALLSGTSAENGENYLIPEDVRLGINELRRSYISAKDIVTVTTTNALTGSENWEKGTPSGLTSFNDGDTIPEEADPQFERKTFTIGFRGKLIPISRILIGAEQAGLMAYLNRWFVKNATITENADIFAKLKAGYNSGKPLAVDGWRALKKSINTALEPACLIGGVIVTNQSGFACLDEEEDNDGRPVLQPNPANSTQKLFQGLPVIVFPDTHLPNIDSTHFPMIYGDTKAGCTFVDYQSLEFAISEHFGFDKNQNYMRVIEGYDVMSTDTSAYIYGSFAATSAAAE
jgi:HK97 family phage major capsid protein